MKMKVTSQQEKRNMEGNSIIAILNQDVLNTNLAYIFQASYTFSIACLSTLMMGKLAFGGSVSNCEWMSNL